MCFKHCKRREDLKVDVKRELVINHGLHSLQNHSYSFSWRPHQTRSRFFSVCLILFVHGLWVFVFVFFNGFCCFEGDGDQGDEECQASKFKEYGLNELRKATNGFSSAYIVSESGEKAPNIVYRGKLENNRLVAVKRFSKQSWPDAQQFVVRDSTSLTLFFYFCVGWWEIWKSGHFFFAGKQKLESGFNSFFWIMARYSLWKMYLPMIPFSRKLFSKHQWTIWKQFICLCFLLVAENINSSLEH